MSSAHENKEIYAWQLYEQQYAYYLITWKHFQKIHFHLLHVR